MLTLIVGTPGSGKTVYAVDKLLKISNHELEQFKEIEYIYNNISGFDFTKFQDHDINFKKLDFEKLYLHLINLYNLYLENESKDNLDDILCSYCKENELFNSYFIIDECHNFFDNQDRVKMWWLTYHRHLHHEIDFITQNKTLIHTKYRNIPELFIQAQPRTKAISKNQMRYFHYTAFTMRDSQKFATSTIKVTKSHFSIYKSGNTSKQKQVGRKFIYMFIIFIVIMISAFILLFQKLTPDSTTKTNNSPSSLNDSSLDDPTNEDIPNTNLNIKIPNFEKLKFMSLKCDKKVNYCYFNNKKMSLDTYLKLKDIFDIKELSVTPLYNNVVQLDILAHEYFYFIFERGYQNEKDNNNNTNIYTNTFK